MNEIARAWLMLRELERGARRTRADLRDRQGRLLRAAVAHAYANVPFYRRVWRAAAVDPAAIRSIDDLSRLPIISGDDVRSAVDAGELVTRAVDTSTYPTFPSSGTSGRALHVPRGPIEARLWRAAGLRMLRVHGHRWRHATVQFDPPPTGAHLLQRWGLMRTTWIPPSLPLDDQVARLVAARPAVIVGTPTVLRRIGRAVTGRGGDAIKPGIVICQGEILDAGTRVVLRDAFGSDPIGVYGMTEIGYIGWQCEKRRAFHVNAEFFAVEVLRDGVAAAPGALGNVVITALRSRTMPLLRYDTGDLSVAGAPACDCGRSLPTLNPIEGRANRAVRLPDGRRVTTRAIVDGLGAFLTPDDFRIEEDSERVFRLRLTRSAAGGRDVAGAVGQLRALLEASDIRIDVGDWPHDGHKTEVLPIARS